MSESLNSKEIAKILYGMELLDCVIIQKNNIRNFVTRVPGGWLFEGKNEHCFVPISDEYMYLLKDRKEKP